MINIQSLSVSYGREKALEDISLRVEGGTTCALIGPSGCGKTTLLYTLAGLLRPAKGTIAINNQELKGVRKETGLILQNCGLLPWKRVWDNIAFPLKSRGIPKEEVQRRTSEILKRLDIYEQRGKFPEELSGGQKQRTAIGRTLALRPDLLLMDEASSALDAISKEQLQRLVLDIFKEDAITLIMVTHNIEEAVFLGQKIVVMNKGSIKRIIHNKYFGDRELREKPEFYKVCQEVRRVLYE